MGIARVLGSIAALLGIKHKPKRRVVELKAPEVTAATEGVTRIRRPSKHGRLGLPRRRRERPARRAHLNSRTFSRAVLGHLPHPLALYGWKTGPEHENARRLARNALRRTRKAAA